MGTYREYGYSAEAEGVLVVFRGVVRRELLLFCPLVRGRRAAKRFDHERADLHWHSFRLL